MIVMTLTDKFLLRRLQPAKHLRGTIFGACGVLVGMPDEAELLEGRVNSILVAVHWNAQHLMAHPTEHHATQTASMKEKNYTGNRSERWSCQWKNRDPVRVAGNQSLGHNPA
jgi:hypothetical protein